LPIIFPAVAEKVIEKIVEKVKEVTKYIAVNFTNNITKMTYLLISKPRLLSPKSITSLLTTISIFVYSLKLYITKLSFSIITKVSRPIGTIIASFSISIVGRSCMDVKKYYPSYSIIKNPSRPLGSLLGQFSIAIAQGICMDAKKLYPSYSIVSRPQKPTPTVTQFSTLVGVRKSP
jgi:hypothetical protein